MAAASQELTERAKLLIAERRYQEAVRACRRALLSQPDQVEVRLLLGEALLALSRYDEVRVEMMALLRRAPERADAHRLLGEAYLRDGRQAQAIQSLRRAAELDPSDEATRDLLSEAKDDAAPPPSTTIERWFAEDAQPTVETVLPEFEEDHTGPVPIIKGGPVAPLPPLQPEPTKPLAQPRVRSRQPTVAGMPMDAPLPAPKPFQAKVPAPSSLTAPTAEPKPAAPTFGGPSPFGGAAPFGGPPGPARAPVGPSVTRAARPPARPVPSAEPATDELAIEPDSTDLEAEPTRAHEPAPKWAPPKEPKREPATEWKAPSEAPTHAARPEAVRPRPDAPRKGVLPAPVDELESAQTNAFNPVTDADLVEEEPTLAPPPKPRSVAPPASSRPAPSFPEPPRPAPAPFVEGARAPLPPAEPVRKQPPKPAPRSSTPTPVARPVSRARPRLLIPLMVGVVALLIVIGGAWLAVDAWLESSATEEIRSLALAASNSGTRADLEAVLRRLDEAGDETPERRALRARILATLVLEHGDDRAAEAGAIVQELAAEPTDARIASAYLLLARGEPQASLQALSHLPAEGDQILEGYRARALATAALGRTGQAREAAEMVLHYRPIAPRHLALAALADHLDGHGGDGLARLERMPGLEQSAAARVARARILQETGNDPRRAVEEATAVIEQLAPGATRYELAWAHLVIARNALGAGAVASALQHARLAAVSPPPVDEPFGLGLAEVLLRAGVPAEADQQLARLNAPAVDPNARAVLGAEVALAIGELDRAERALAGAQDSARKSYLLGRVAEQRGRITEARPHYERAMAAPGPDERRARVRLGAIAMREGQAAQAIALLEPARAGGVDDLELVGLLVRAYLAAGRLDSAQDTVRGALTQHPDSVELLAVQGSILLRRGQPREAMATLERAAGLDARNVEVQLDLGDAARATGERDRARTAYDRALVLRAGDARAIGGLARLLFDERRYDEAIQRLAGQSTVEAARIRAEIAVRKGDGAASVEAVRALVREHDRDALLWAMLGHLFSQAEQDGDASDAYREASRRDRDLPEVFLGRAVLEARGGSPRAARRALESAEASARRDNLDVRARLLATQARVDFEEGRFDSAVTSAREAVTLEPHNAMGHFVLAMVALEREESALDALRATIAGDGPPAEALARLAIRLGVGEEGCNLGRRYLQVAPRGYDADDVREVVDRCR